MDDTKNGLVKESASYHFENYADRNAGAKVGVYEGQIKEFIHSYVKPQENGNRTGVEWLKLTNDTGQGLMVDGAELLSVAVWPWSQEMLEKAKYTSELLEDNFTTVNIDLIQAGVGGTKPGGKGARALPKYQLKAGHYRYTFTLSAIQ